MWRALRLGKAPSFTYCIGSGISKSEALSEARCESSYIAFTLFKRSRTWKTFGGRPASPFGTGGHLRNCVRVRFPPFLLLEGPEFFQVLFLHISFIFSIYSFIFLRIFLIFLHISFIFSSYFFTFLHISFIFFLYPS